MFDSIKDFLANFFKSRLFLLAAVMMLLFGILLQRVFVLQIVNGEEYLNHFTLRIEKQRELPSTRGNIYDRKGNLLAYNELAYTITIEDNGSYASEAEKNSSINHVLAQIFEKMDANGDSIDNSFEIKREEDGTYSYTSNGNARNRFLADVYGRSKTEDLAYNKKLGYNEAKAEPKQVMDYLMSSSRFGIAGEYEGLQAYRIAVIRFAMSKNSYQKYISTTIATDVCDETIAYISENASELQGVEISAVTLRKYVDSKYFAQIIGYTGTISKEEYEEKKEGDYSLTDVVGKSGIEQYLDLQLRGEKGTETVYVDNLGKVIETKEREEPKAGNNVYLSIDAKLTKAVYDLLEMEIAGILYDNIRNVKNYDASAETSASDVIIPIDDVYFALIQNNVINIDRFFKKDASRTEQEIYQAFLAKQTSVLALIQSELSIEYALPFGQLDNEAKDYISYIVNLIKTKGILVEDKINMEDEVYAKWADGTISFREYLNHAIAKNWIDITQFSVDEKYADSNEIYDALKNFILEELREDRSFSKIIYKYMIHHDLIDDTKLCIILYDQGMLEYDGNQVAALTSGTISAYNFIRDRIKNLEITPAQLALDPCTGSCVITDVRSGELLALVSYPGYDNNRLANTMDAEYWEKLRDDKSKPLYNNATQERTAPGSTFKMLSATAGFAENVIDTEIKIQDEGRFTRLEEKGPKCWIYPASTHGLINVSEAIRDSCNYFFYEIGYRLSLNGLVYNEKKGLQRIQKYASLYGLDEPVGIEIPESAPQIADEYPITASIGQSNNNYTTAQIARYVTAIANKGTVYKETLLKEIRDSKNKKVSQKSPEIKNTVDVLSEQQWNAIHSGMRMMAEESVIFKDFPIPVAGKTGTAQQVTNRPNHALFVGFAPYNRPKISIATRIAFGYTSHNAADISKDILAYYFGIKKADELINGQAKNVSGSSNAVTD